MDKIHSITLIWYLHAALHIKEPAKPKISATICHTKGRLSKLLAGLHDVYQERMEVTIKLDK